MSVRCEVMWHDMRSSWAFRAPRLIVCFPSCTLLDVGFVIFLMKPSCRTDDLRHLAVLQTSDPWGSFHSHSENKKSEETRTPAMVPSAAQLQKHVFREFRVNMTVANYTLGWDGRTPPRAHTHTRTLKQTTSSMFSDQIGFSGCFLCWKFFSHFIKMYLWTVVSFIITNGEKAELKLEISVPIPASFILISCQLVI